MQELKRHWDIAISNEPLGREAADAAFNAARQILSTMPLPDLVHNTGLAGNIQPDE
jgi:hypothetical protein